MKGIVTLNGALAKEIKGLANGIGVVLCKGKEYFDLTEALFKAVSSGCDRIYLDCRGLNLNLFMWGTIFSGVREERIKEVVLVNCDKAAVKKLDLYKDIRFQPAEKINLFRSEVEGVDFLTTLGIRPLSPDFVST